MAYKVNGKRSTRSQRDTVKRTLARALASNGENIMSAAMYGGKVGRYVVSINFDTPRVPSKRMPR